jgi:glycolate oxidase FAD binding subunit
VIACNLAGPRRIRQGAARDHFLGFAAVSGRGEAFKAGGRVVKNVTGYDLPKLMAGSFGTLAALTEVTLKVLPAPEATATLVLLGLDDTAARRAMGAALASPHEVSGAAHIPAAEHGDAARTLVRIEGHAPSVAARRAALERELGAFAPIETLSGEAALALWRGVRELEPLAASRERALWRVSIPPTRGPEAAAEISAGHDTRHFFDWGGGLLWIAVAGAADGGAAAIRAAVRGEGHATLIHGPDALRAAIDVFEPQPPALAQLSARVKAQFDPRRILNRGRMYRDL